MTVSGGENASKSAPFVWPTMQKEARIRHLKPSPAVEDPLYRVSKADQEKAQILRSASSAAFSNPLMRSSPSDDPLSQMAAEVDDPLSATIARNTKSSSSHKLAEQRVSALPVGFVPWSVKRTEILDKFTTTEKLAMNFDLMPGSGVDEKVAKRLDQLDELEEAQMTGTRDMTQKEYIARIEEMNSSLMSAWDSEERVKALKIAIQCTKLLNDVSVIGFYPSKFVLITDILDTFGGLVYDRILAKSSFFPKGALVPQRLPDDFTPEMVPESAKETCRNWFYKISSIREMLPRLYVEASILKCYSFLSANECNCALSRIIAMIRGIGDPLVAAYTRAYLCRVGVKLAPQFRDIVRQNFEDFLLCLKQLESPTVNNITSAIKLEIPAYYQLFLPAVEWLVQCVSFQAESKTLDDLARRCGRHPILMHSVFCTFPPQYVCEHIQQFTEFIRASDDSLIKKSELYRLLGEKCVIGEVKSSDRLELLNGVWKVVMKIENPSQYMRVANVWLEFAAKNLKPKEVDLLLKGIIKHISVDRKFEKLYPELLAAVRCIIRRTKDLNLLFTIENFLALIDLFQTEATKFEVNHLILETFINSTVTTCSDPVIINAVMYVCKNLHDNLSFSSNDNDDQKIVVGELVQKFIDRVSFQDDFEAQLNFCVEARGNFFLLDNVIISLIFTVNSLIMATLKKMEGKHTKRTASFIRACIAYNYITIPSVDNIQQRLSLYLTTAQVALLNLSVAQADAFFTLIMSAIPELPVQVYEKGSSRSKTTDTWLVDYMANVFSTMILLPDYPEDGVLSHFKKAIEAVKDYPFTPDSVARVRVYILALQLLAGYSQKDWPYAIPGVDHNGVLYAGGQDKRFAAEAGEIGKFIVKEVNAALENSKSGPPPVYLVDYLLVLLTTCQFSSPMIGKVLSMHLPRIARSSQATPKRVIGSVLKSLQRKHPEAASEVQVLINLLDNPSAIL